MLGFQVDVLINRSQLCCLSRAFVPVVYFGFRYNERILEFGESYASFNFITFTCGFVVVPGWSFRSDAGDD